MNALKWLSICGLIALTGAAEAQHLIWRPKDDQGSYTCIYGEIKVLESAPTTYYCGCNWWPSAPAGGYTGIQDVDGIRHLMIFSIWDTSPELHSVPVTKGDPRTRLKRFGGEGEGGQSILDYQWQVGRTYRYFVVKRQNPANNSTLATTYFHDDESDRWVNEATIESPNGDKSVKGFGGMMNAFLENWSGQRKEVPRLAVYRLWVGTSPSDLSEVTEASGDGDWGVLNDWFYLASGGPIVVKRTIQANQIGGVEAKEGGSGRLQIPDTKLGSDLLNSLQNLYGAK